MVPSLGPFIQYTTEPRTIGDLDKEIKDLSSS